MNLLDFVNIQAELVTKKYKMPKKDVEERVLLSLNGNKSFLKIVENARDIKDVERTRDYKEFIKNLKKDVYYSLRRYRSDPLKTADHISVKEREPYISDFNSLVFEHFSQAEYITDIGGGVFPTTFPFEKYTKLKKYIWIDKDAKAYELLKSLNNPKLVLYNHSIGDKPWNYYLPDGVQQFDAAFMIKLISVIYRQQRHLISNLSEVPAHGFVVTVPKEAMAKKESIERRERAVLKQFVQATGRNISGELDIPNEFGYFLR